MSLYIQQLAKMISNQLGRLYRHTGADSDGAAWFLICTSLISQQKQAIHSRSGLPGVEAFDEKHSKHNLLSQLNIVMR
jgi:hypothetical protein